MSETTNKKRIMALSSLRRRSAAGDLEALATLGRALALGELGQPDRATAWAVLTAAAEAGHAAARRDLANLESVISPQERRAGQAQRNGTEGASD